VWFTLSHGIVNEVYYPRVDVACTRDLGLIVTDGREFFSEEKRDAESRVGQPIPGVPAYHLINTCRRGRYRIEKELITHPDRDLLLQRIRFAPLLGSPADYRLYVLLAPHLGNRGAGNTAWVGDVKGTPMLLAERDSYALALACSVPWKQRSAGFVGVSDGWQDLSRHFRMTWECPRAENGNVALTGEVNLGPAGQTFVLALGFGRTADEAGHHALAGLMEDFGQVWRSYSRDWAAWQETLLPLHQLTPHTPTRAHVSAASRDPVAAPDRDAGDPAAPAAEGDPYRTSTMVIRTHESKDLPGGVVASLSIPWGSSKGDDDLGGYHLVWPRDLVEAAGGLLAAGAHDDVRRILTYLRATQEADGHWPQNMWLDGTPFWQGVQLDETALPILLVDLARREGAVCGDMAADWWPMVRRAAGFVVRSGPVTQQDRWEEDPGYAPFTLAAAIAALLAAADIADLAGDAAASAYLRETADAWYAGIDRWTYATGTEDAARYGVDGYYVRITPPETADAASPREGFVPIKNRPLEQSSTPAAHIISPDALALVRFGLRAPDDPRIRNTVRVIDALLKVDTPRGPVWHRYNGDGYGEHASGAPFDGTGAGRAWPLLTGERAHYELAAGRRDEALRLLRTMEALAGETGLLPEQIWDSADIPERELFFGRPSGSAMPLVWAHAEHVKLRRSLRDGRVFDTPAQPVRRYLLQSTPSSRHAIWRFNHKCRSMAPGMILRVEVPSPAVVHWSDDLWQNVHDIPTRATGLGLHVADLPTAALPAGRILTFTFRWLETARWEGVDFQVSVEPS